MILNHDPSPLSYGNDPTPRYPVEQAVDNGQCVKGWLLFEVPSGVTIDTIRYATTESGGAPIFATWRSQSRSATRCRG